MLVLLADLVPEVGGEELVEEVEVREIPGAVVTGPDGDDLLGEKVGLDAPVLAQPHDQVFDEVLVVVEQF